jgi:hypothetical protein
MPRTVAISTWLVLFRYQGALMDGAIVVGVATLLNLVSKLEVKKSRAS